MCIDLPKAWFTSRHDRPGEMAGVMFTTVFLSKLEGFFLGFRNAIGMPKYEPQQQEKQMLTAGKLQVESSSNTRLDFSFLTMRPTLVLGGTRTLVVEELDPQTVRVWFVSHLAIRGEAVRVTAQGASPHPLFGEVPELFDEHEVEVTSTAQIATVWMERLYSRLLLDSTITMMMRRKPLIMFFEEE
jgi:hypothetical protein